MVDQIRFSNTSSNNIGHLRTKLFGR